jgi:hypothetical protein
MRVTCRTNLDLRGERWPDELPCLPNVGDQIESATRWGSFRLSLKVVAIRWKYRAYDCDSLSDYENRWYPEIELHMTDYQMGLQPKNYSPDSKTGAQPGSIVAFYDWYAPLVGKTTGSFI